MIAGPVVLVLIALFGFLLGVVVVKTMKTVAGDGAMGEWLFGASARLLAGTPTDRRSAREAALEARHVRTLATELFRTQRCAICGADLTGRARAKRPPVLRAPDGTSVDWTLLSRESFAAAALTHAPVCWSCHLADEFRRRYPDLVTDRPHHISLCR